ncbi:hypothetical protein [Actinokineospora sp.]|uniref:phosphoribosylanthranilate isomerase n=1 Tax=Actinokineospora sp. TaxID=1872133 RepID=UPI0040383EA1
MTGTAIVKVCGARTADELALLAAAGVDLSGVWCGVAGGYADLRADAAAALLAATRPTQVLVTLAGSELPDLVDRTGARWVQLHGHQPPKAVRELKAREVTVITVLHLRGGKCPQAGLIPAYERAGTDYFLLDTAAEDGRLGSTGESSCPVALAGLARRLSTPFLLAGGLTADNRDRFAEVLAEPGFRGVDVDTAARSPAGVLDRARVAALVEAWKAAQ